MPDSFEVYKTLVASTGHCEQYDFDACRIFPEIFAAVDHEYGMSIYLGSLDADGNNDILSNISSMRISEGLKLLILFAVSIDCLWLKLDVDGPTYERFPIYEW